MADEASAADLLDFARETTKAATARMMTTGTAAATIMTGPPNPRVVLVATDELLELGLP